MKHPQRLLAALLAAVLLASVPVLAAAAEGLEYFQPVNIYTSGTFRDVPASSWYAESVGAAYELSFMQGTGKREFEPGLSITLAETVAWRPAYTASTSSIGPVCSPAETEMAPSTRALSSTGPA